MRRVVRALYASIGGFLVLAVSVPVRGTAPLEAVYPYYVFLLGISVVLAVAQAFMQSAIMVICTQLTVDGTLMGYMLAGQALQGVFGSVVNLVSTMLAVQLDKGAPSSDTKQAHENANAAMAVFLTTTLLQATTLVCLWRALRLPAVSERMDAWGAGAEERSRSSDGFRRLMRVQKRILPWSASIFCVFLVTLGVYPALTSQARSVHSRPDGTLVQSASVFVALHIVAMNLGDLIGRRLPVLSPYLLIRHGWVSLACTTLRFFFFPLFFACNLVGESNKTPAWALPDAAFFALVFFLGVTTGCNSTSILISGPKKLEKRPGAAVPLESAATDDVEQDRLLDAPSAPHDGDASIASMILSFWLVLGLTAGSCFSFLVLAL